jgi:hypothetical protein
MLISCADTRKSSGVITSREATAIWHAYEILPDYHNYYAGPDAQSFMCALASCQGFSSTYPSQISFGLTSEALFDEPTN